MNKPFKNAVRNAYRDHLDNLFQVHLAAGRRLEEFSPKLTMGALKPFFTTFVAKGILALKTPEMRECIRTCFANDGCFGQMRSTEVQLAAQMECTDMIADAAVNVEEEEDDKSVEELAYATDLDDIPDDSEWLA